MKKYIQKQDLLESSEFKALLKEKNLELKDNKLDEKIINLAWDYFCKVSNSNRILMNISRVEYWRQNNGNKLFAVSHNNWIETEMSNKITNRGYNILNFTKEDGLEIYLYKPSFSEIWTDRKGNPHLTQRGKIIQDHQKVEKGFLGGTKRTYRKGKWKLIKDISDKCYKLSIDIVAIANLINNGYTEEAPYYKKGIEFHSPSEYLDFNSEMHKDQSFVYYDLKFYEEKFAYLQVKNSGDELFTSIKYEDKIKDEFKHPVQQKFERLKQNIESLI